MSGEEFSVVSVEDDYQLEYSEDTASESDCELENLYYAGKTMKESQDLNGALEHLQKVLTKQGENKGKWGFKALKQMIKIHFQLKNYQDVMQNYKEFLTYIKQSVTKNLAEKSINSILSYTVFSENMDMLIELYEMTLEALTYVQNDRLWFKTNTKLGKVYLEQEDFVKANLIIKQLYQICQTSKDEYYDEIKGAQILEIYALEMQMYFKQNKMDLLVALYERSLKVNSSIADTLTTSVIRECGGKMYFNSKEYEKSYKEFLEAFKTYEIARSPKRIACLKYLLLTGTLIKPPINVFDSQDADRYILNPEIQMTTNLSIAYQKVNVIEFEEIVKQVQENLLADSFMCKQVEDLRKNIRIQALVSLVKPYKTIKLGYISTELNLSPKDTEDLIASCITDGHLRGKIDQIKQLLVIPQDDGTALLYEAAQQLANRIDSLTRHVLDNLD